MIIVAISAVPTPFVDPALYASFLEAIAFMVVVPLTYLNHLFTRRSSTILLSCYPIYVISSVVFLRTLFQVHGSRHSTSTFGLVYRNLSVVQTAVVFLAWILECVGQEVDDESLKVEKSVNESPYLTANLYSR